jgi:glycosyltransferase involved in cell wall biosynthesis
MMTTQATKKLALQVEGWRGISHSYALVNQFQLLHWHKSNLASIHHIDMPFVMAHWASGENSAGFQADDMHIIQNISEPMKPDAIYRIFAPFGLDTPVDLPTVTYAVTEFGLNDSNYNQEMVNRYAARGGKIHTPSTWSKNRLMASGMPEEIIHVIPHAADPNYFFQMDAQSIAKNREAIGYKSDDVILLNVGTHHWNKGLDLLITAFAKARQKNKRLKLLLKDQRSTYLMNSESYVHQTLSNIGMNDPDTVDAIRLLSGHLDLSQLNALYNVADAYVTPYRAEGFNLPALEAQTCGTHVIATAGGATSDFLSAASTSNIDGRLVTNANLKSDLKINSYIEPDLNSLINTLENLNPKKKYLPIKNLTWNEAISEINTLFRFQKYE